MHVNHRVVSHVFSKIGTLLRQPNDVQAKLGGLSGIRRIGGVHRLPSLSGHQRALVRQPCREVDRTVEKPTGWRRLRSRRIDEIRRAVRDVPVQVRVAGGEAERVLAQEPAQVRVVPAGQVVLQAGVFVEDLACKPEERLERGVRLRSDVPEAVVLQVIDDGGRVGAGVVLGDVADGAEVVGEKPGDGSGAVFVGEDLAGVGAVQQAIRQVSGRIEDERDRPLTLALSREGRGTLEASYANLCALS